MNDIRISGSGSVGGGEYNSVHINGSGRIDGAVTCKTYASSGSSRVKGGIKCDEFASSGASHIEGSVDCSGTFSTSGAAHIDGDLHGDTAKCSGSLSVGKNIDIREGRFSGSLSAEGDVSAEKVVLSGAARIKGLLNAETVEINVGLGNMAVEIGSVGGGSITVKCKSGGNVFGFFKMKDLIFMKTTSIEADRVELECTEADIVRATDVVIGDSCRIGTVEYSGLITVSENAKVEKTVKV